MEVTRRALLAGVGLACTSCGSLPDVPSVAPGRRLSGVLTSQARGGLRCGWTIAWPPGRRRGLPVVVVLHGRGNDHASAFSSDYLALDRYLARAVGLGTPPYALASIDGGEAYWHARADGDDPAAMVVDELLPLLSRHGLDTGRLGFLGWSMGGYGALHLGGVLGPSRVAAVAAMSPALWHEYADSAPGAFDDAADLAANTVLGRQSDLDGVAVRVDCGDGDPFAPVTRDYRAGFDVPPAGGIEPGDHELAYWRRLAGRELAFLGAHL